MEENKGKGKNDKFKKNEGQVLHNIFNTETYETRHNLVFIKSENAFYLGRFRTRSDHFNIILKNAYYCSRKTDKRTKYKITDFSQFPRIFIREINLTMFDLGVQAEHSEYPSAELFLKMINKIES